MKTNKYARSLGNVVVETFEHEVYIPSDTHNPEIAAQFKPCSLEVATGYIYNPEANTYSAPPPVIPDPVYVVKIDCPVAVAQGTEFEISVRLEDEATGELQPFTETYYVPLKNVTTDQTVKMLVLPLVDGACTLKLTLTSIGLYDVLEEQIRPVPTAKMAATTNISVY